MKQLLINILEEFCPNNVYLQGTLNPDEKYPESFLTFWLDDTEDHSNFDGNTYSIDWYFSVMFYSSSPELVNTVPQQIISALKANGFVISGKGQDLPSDIETHTGWVFEATKTEYLI